MYDWLFGPFIEFEFMRRALAGTTALALGAGPIGVFLMLRRMSLVGDAMAHAILPGAAIGFLISGLSLFAMTAGGLIAGCVVALLTGVVARMTELKEDAALATFYLLSLALGVTIVSMVGTNIDLLHVLFGSVLALDNQTLLLIAFNATITLIVLALIYRPLLIECVDPGFLRSVSRAGGPAHIAFLALVVMNLVGGFHALGTLLAVGIMMLPAVIARFWARDVTAMILIAVGAGVVARVTELKEDASLAAFFLISLAVGVTIVSLKGNNVDLLHFLFGSVLALDDPTLLLIAGITTISLTVLAVIYRPLVLECVDPGFLRSVSRAGAPVHIAFLALVVMNLVGGFHALGTLLAVGIMMLPAVIARFWARDITTMILIAVVSGAISGYAGLLVSFHTGAPSGPAIILVAGVLYAASVVFGRVGGLIHLLFPGRHLEA